MKRLGLLLLFCASSPTHAATVEPQKAPAPSEVSFNSEKTYISVGAARAKKTVIALPDVRIESAAFAVSAKEVFDTLKNDLTYMDLFRFISSSAFLEKTTEAGISPGTFKYPAWSGIGAEFLIKTGVVSAPNQMISLEGYLYDVKGAQQILARKYVVSVKDMKLATHAFANDVVKTLTGLPGIFLTKIAMSCDLTGKKEIYISNFDGSEVKQLTRHHSIAFAPAWSPDSSRLAYSLFTRHSGDVKNIDLYEFNFTNSTLRLLSDHNGINSGAAYSPDGKTIALTMSFNGNPEIYGLNTSDRSVKRLTHSLGVEVDPAWSPDGKHLAFVSNRTGMPMIFKMDLDGSNIERLTIAGRYNATPSWSIQNKIVFAGWIDQNFDIFTMTPRGKNENIERLTKDQKSNEDPSFSPDGNFIVFSSNRTGQKNIYVMNVDGSFVRRLTYGLGNCVSPKWSNPPIPKVSDVQH